MIYFLFFACYGVACAWLGSWLGRPFIFYGGIIIAIINFIQFFYWLNVLRYS